MLLSSNTRNIQTIKAPTLEDPGSQELTCYPNNVWQICVEPALLPLLKWPLTLPITKKEDQHSILKCTFI